MAKLTSQWQKHFQAENKEYAGGLLPTMNEYIRLGLISPEDAQSVLNVRGKEYATGNVIPYSSDYADASEKAESKAFSKWSALPQNRGY